MNKQTETQKQGPVVVERTYNVPVEKVWSALTDKDEMKKWYFDLSEFRPELGFEFRFVGQGHKGENYMHVCRITQVVPLKKLAYSWKYENYQGMSEVTFELFSEGNKTRVKVTHTGLDSFPANNPDFARESFNQGWTEILGKMLREYLEKA